MKFLAIALIFALWGSDAARANRGVANLVRRPLARKIMELNSTLVKQTLAGMNVENVSPIIGIDLGTTNSAMAWVKDGVPTIIPNIEGGRTTPSVVDFSSGGGVGDAAVAELEFSPEKVIYSAKRLMGLSYREAKEKGLIDSLNYKVVEGDGGIAMIEVNGKQYLPQQIAAKVLAKLKADAEKALGVEITKAVVTVPARFDNRQKLATKEAGEIAGLTVSRIVAEPTAAALAHGFGRGAEKKIVIFDLGGGTFDVTVLDFDVAGDMEMGEVLTTEGNPLLGGDDFDNRIVQHLVEKLKADEGVDVSNDPEAMAELKAAAIEAKENLTGSESTTIQIRKLGEQSIDVRETLTRARFNELTSDLIEQTIAMTKKALENENLTVDDIDQVLGVGGSIRIVAVREALADLFGAKKISLEDNPDEVVALGATVQAGVLAGDIKGITLLDTTSLDLGIEVVGGIFAKIIAKDTTIPTEQSQVFTTQVDNQAMVTTGIFQGDEGLKQVKHMEKIGEVTLNNIPPAPRGVPQIEVNFAIDADGLVKVTVKDAATDNQEEVTVAANALSEERIEKMQTFLEENKEEIEAEAKLTDAKNKLEGLVVQIEGVLRQSGDKLLPTESKVALENAVEAAKGSINSDKIETIENAIKGLESQSHAVFGNKDEQTAS